MTEEKPEKNLSIIVIELLDKRLENLETKQDGLSEDFANCLQKLEVSIAASFAGIQKTFEELRTGLVSYTLRILWGVLIILAGTNAILILKDSVKDLRIGKDLFSFTSGDKHNEHKSEK